MIDPVELFPGTVLRAATLEDLRALSSIQKQKPVAGVPDVEAVLRQRILAKQVVGVFQNGVCVAGAVLERRGDIVDGLKLVSTSAGYGLLKRGIDEVAKELKEQGVKSFIGRCPRELKPFYARLGFEETGVMPNYFGKGKDGLSLRRVI